MIDTYNEMSWILIVTYETDRVYVGPFRTYELAQEYVDKYAQKHIRFGEVLRLGQVTGFDIERMGFPEEDSN